MYTLGIDLHKKSSVWMLIDEQRTELWKEDVLCHPDHITTAVKNIPVPLREIQVAIEPVAGWRWVSGMLEDVGMDVHIAHPRKIQLIAKSTKKTDTEDARTLANLLCAGYFPEAHKSSDDIYQLRLLLRERTFIIRQRTSIKNQIHGIATTQGLHEIKSGNPLFKKGKADIMAGQNFILKQLHHLVEDFEKRVIPFDERLQKELVQCPIAQLLMTFPGVGMVTALTVVAEVDDFTRFGNSKKLVSFAGLVPRQRSSGDVIHYGAITHAGSASLRTALVETAMRIRASNAPELYAFVHRLAPICGAKKARVALARKILCIMWKMVVSNTPYQPHILPSAYTTNVSDLDTVSGT
ncbi:MAG: IS110 family transposase [Candidatus Kaiserbacteria bacterium]|nr:IS110 family transposase [Candidatus Kaiserbacteria bacterium]